MTFLCIDCGKKLDENNFYREAKNRCEDFLYKKFKSELSEKFLTKKLLTTHIEREHHQQVSSSTVIEVDNVDHNNRTTLLFGPSFSGKTYLMFKILSRTPIRDIYKITKL